MGEKDNSWNCPASEDSYTRIKGFDISYHYQIAACDSYSARDGIIINSGNRFKGARMMFPNLSQMNIFIIPGATDMRKQIRGLSAVLFDLDLDLQAPNLFIFCGKTRKILKILYWDFNGFCLWQKKLEKDKFPWPMNQDEVETIDLEKLTLLLIGIDFWQEHKSIAIENFF